MSPSLKGHAEVELQSEAQVVPVLAIRQHPVGGFCVGANPVDAIHVSDGVNTELNKKVVSGVEIHPTGAANIKRGLRLIVDVLRLPRVRAVGLGALILVVREAFVVPDAGANEAADFQPAPVSDRGREDDPAMELVKVFGLVIVSPSVTLILIQPYVLD